MSFMTATSNFYPLSPFHWNHQITTTYVVCFRAPQAGTPVNLEMLYRVVINSQMLD